MLELREKVSVITGISGQLGPIWKETLEDMGSKIFPIDLPECDISDIDQVSSEVCNCIEKVGAPDILINNAAIDNPPGTKTKFHSNVENILSVNVIGACNVVDSFLPSMIENGGGVIVNIGSIQGFIGADWRNYDGDFEKPVGYNLSKAAIMQYSRSLTVQYGRYGVRSVCIAFGPYDGGKLDPIFINKFLKNVPMKRPVSTESLKSAMRFAVTCPEFAGQTVLVDGGYTIL